MKSKPVSDVDPDTLRIRYFLSGPCHQKTFSTTLQVRSIRIRGFSILPGFICHLTKGKKNLIIYLSPFHVIIYLSPFHGSIRIRGSSILPGFICHLTNGKKNLIIYLSPLHDLFMTLLGRIDLLRRLFGKIHCPDLVLLECLHPQAPVELRGVGCQRARMDLGGPDAGNRPRPGVS
jgi:hypothetical protein